MKENMLKLKNFIVKNKLLSTLITILIILVITLIIFLATNKDQEVTTNDIVDEVEIVGNLGESATEFENLSDEDVADEVLLNVDTSEYEEDEDVAIITDENTGKVTIISTKDPDFNKKTEGKKVTIGKVTKEGVKAKTNNQDLVDLGNKSKEEQEKTVEVETPPSTSSKNTEEKKEEPKVEENKENTENKNTNTETEKNTEKSSTSNKTEEKKEEPKQETKPKEETKTETKPKEEEKYDDAYDFDNDKAFTSYTVRNKQKEQEVVAKVKAMMEKSEFNKKWGGTCRAVKDNTESESIRKKAEARNLLGSYNEANIEKLGSIETDCTLVITVYDVYTYDSTGKEATLSDCWIYYYEIAE